jgi:hypothetical protein
MIPNDPDLGAAPLSNSSLGEVATSQVPVSAAETSKQVAGSNLETTMMFASATEVSEFDSRDNIMHPYDVSNWAKVGVEDDLKSFLMRPAIVATGSLSTTAFTVYNTFRPTTIITTIDNFNQKVKGAMGIRATTCFRVIVNVTPFSQGVISMFYYPNPAATPVNALRTDFPLGWTQLPHVNINVGFENSAVLKIPYVSQWPYLNYLRPETDNFEMRLVNYSPLVTGAGALGTPTYTVYCWFEDVELTKFYYAQSGRRKMRNLEDSENSTDSTKVSAILRDSSNVLGRVSSAMTMIPSIAAISGTASWVTAVLAKTAYAFGYSKPLVIDRPMKFLQYYDPCAPNVDGDSNAVVLAGSRDNKVDAHPGIFGVDYDEMSLNYVASVYSFNRVFNWPTSAPTNTILANICLNPFRGLQAISSQPDGIAFASSTSSVSYIDPQFYISPSAVGFVTSFFNYYHGGMKIKLIFVKTRYHAGRLTVVFVPGRDFPLSAALPSYQEGFIKTTIDLSQTETVEMVIPWLNTVPFIGRRGNTIDNYGSLFIYVAERLNAPSTVPSSISVLVEVAAADDAVWAYPRESAYYCNIQGTLAAAGNYKGRVTVSNFGANPFINFAAQSGEKITKIDFGFKHTTPDVSLCQYTFGEYISSFKQLGARNESLPGRNRNNANSTASAFLCDPFHNYVVQLTGTAAVSKQVGIGTLDHMGACYAFATGSMNIAYVRNSSNVANVYTLNNGLTLNTQDWVVGNYTVPSLTDSSNNLLYNPGQPVHATAYLAEPRALTTRIPSYVPFVMRANLPGSSRGGNIVTPSINYLYITQTPTATDGACAFVRSLADDGRYGFYLGAPAVTIDPSTFQ